MENPKVTVLMANYNGEDFLRPTIESVLNQTFKNFEFLIIDDGSTDSSIEIINSYHDDRIVLVKNEQNQGLPVNLNRGIEIAKGEYIARLDADDICTPDRLEKQVEFLDKTPDVGILGTACKYIKGEEILKEINKSPETHDLIKALLIYDCPMHHPTIMMRKNILLEKNLRYDEHKKCGQDYDFWSRAVEYTNISALTEPLVIKRIHDKQITIHRRAEQVNEANEVRRRMVTKILPDMTEEEFNLHNSIYLKEFEPSVKFFKAANNWFEKLIKANRKSNFYYSESALAEIFVNIGLQVCKASGKKFPLAFLFFMTSPLSCTTKAKVILFRIGEKIVG